MRTKHDKYFIYWKVDIINVFCYYRYSREYFNARNLSPFVEEAAHDEQRKKKMKLSKNVSDLQIVSMGLRFLQLDPLLFLFK